MTEISETFDAVVVGAGTAGANAAGQLARRGLRVALVEHRSFDLGGAQWHNGVPPWQFDRAGVARPEAPELTSPTGPLHLFAADGSHAVTVDNPVWPVDMAALGRRLRADATAAGVVVFDHAQDLEVELHGRRCTAVHITGSRSGGPTGRHHLAASLIVDASGRRGVVRSASPILAAWCLSVRGPELCSAGDFQMGIADRAGAEAFLERHQAKPGDGVTVVGCDGGFSTRAIRINAALDHASVLVGCLADGHSSTAPRMFADVRATEPWLGEARVSGTGVIPLRRPYARLSAPGVALVGDAACQVFPAHGSGIGIGMIAGTMLAETVAGATDPGDPAVLWRYQAAFHRDYGELLISYDGVRRMSSALGTAGVTEMVHAGLLNPSLTLAGMDQRVARPAVRELPKMATRLARHPRLAAKVLPRLARTQVAGALASGYPDTPDDDALARWDRRVERALGT